MLRELKRRLFPPLHPRAFFFTKLLLLCETVGTWCKTAFRINEAKCAISFFPRGFAAVCKEHDKHFLWHMASKVCFSQLLFQRPAGKFVYIRSRLDTRSTFRYIAGTVQYDALNPDPLCSYRRVRWYVICFVTWLSTRFFWGKKIITLAGGKHTFCMFSHR